jgi:hypothetical protein
MQLTMTAFEEKKKKAYYVNPNATLSIDNSYGTISVTTWNEDKIELDISIKVSGDNVNWVNQRIRTIAVDIVALKGMISAKTILGIPITKVSKTIILK